jgi:hypothetical protein
LVEGDSSDASDSRRSPHFHRIQPAGKFEILLFEKRKEIDKKSLMAHNPLF